MYVQQPVERTMIKYSKTAKETLDKYLSHKMVECGEDEAISAEVREDLKLHIEQMLMEKSIEVVTDFELRKVLAEMGELEILTTIELESVNNAAQSTGFIRDDDFSIRHRKVIMSVGLLLLCFFFFKFLVFDGLDMKSGETIKNSGPYTFTTNFQPLELDIKDNPEMANIVNRSQTMKLIMLVSLSIGVSFWFWMLVECLSGEKYPQKGIFFRRPEYDRWVWLLAFVFLNIIGALVYKLVTSRKLKLEVLNGC